LEQYPTNAFDLAKSDDLMIKNGWTKDREGFWTKGGQRFHFDLVGWAIFADLGPVLAEQLRQAGFEVEFIMPPDRFVRINEGWKNTAWLFGHGGSTRGDPYRTLDTYNAAYYKPTGETGGSQHRWQNEEFSAIVDEMATVPPGDPKIMELYLEAMEIWLRELPSIPMVQWIHRIPCNTTRWKGWPTEDNPYTSAGFGSSLCPLS
jgi:peptide/nickel transport system substrate-binding protein